ncbi:MAG: hypothetical protein IT436_13150 [Phycisphaerales bacterium]|nr:hypothetical protein [Phycisphaerales bacterium]
MPLCNRAAVAVGLALLARESAALAQVVQYTDRATFLADTGASAEPLWPNLGRLDGGASAAYHLGNLTLSISPPSSELWIGSGGYPSVGPDWTTFVAGNDIAVSGRETLNVDFDVLVMAVGFDFAEPTHATVQYPPCSTLCPCANSNFSVTLYREGSPVGQFTYNRPDDTAAFVGFVSVDPFDRIEVRELDGTCDDEYFGRFWTLAAACTCPADLNCDGLADFADYLEFLNFYDAEDPRADVNQDGLIDFADYLEFLNLYEAGC